MADSLADQAIEEVHALHAFFVDWFRGAKGSPEDFSVREASLAADFRLINPDGTIDGRGSIIERLRAARGSASPHFTIEVLQPRVVWQSADAALLEYVEQQYRDGRTTRRLSTALFTPSQAAPHGVAWRHLQETWMLSNEGRDAGNG